MRNRNAFKPIISGVEGFWNFVRSICIVTIVVFLFDNVDQFSIFLKAPSPNYVFVVGRAELVNSGLLINILYLLVCLNWFCPAYSHTKIYLYKLIQTLRIPNQVNRLESIKYYFNFICMVSFQRYNIEHWLFLIYRSTLQLK